MVTETNTQTNYRYPGIRPFYDNDIDRRLFFGRDTEKEALLHKVLAENLVVLYARSGLGKTSLLNAGLSQALRDRGFIPLMVRLNNPGLDPVQGIYAGIEEIAKQASIEVEPGEDATLWQYFKTTYFWSDSNKMLTPVLILDQFEEFITFYSPEKREGFMRQLANVVNNKIPALLLESVKPEGPLPYSDNPPNVKIIISIGEDCIGQLEKMSREIPEILLLHHRFHLLPLSREQARQAISKPSQVQDDVIDTASFTFAQEAVNTMLDFLDKRLESDIIKTTNEVESLQLQLLCRHIEDRVQERVKKENVDIIVKIEDYGLDKEVRMKSILQRFYDDQIKKLDTRWKKRKARRLCEKALISENDHRLSLDEEEIKRKFRVSKNLLLELVNASLLRAEPRLGSVYYELSHETLVARVRESQRRRKSKRTKFGIGFILIFMIIILSFFIERNYIQNKKNNAMKHVIFGLEYYEKKLFDKAIKEYRKAIEIDKKYAPAYNNMGNVYHDLKNYNKALCCCKKAIEFDPKYANAYNNKGNAYYGLKNYDKAIAAYEEAIKIDENNIPAYINKGNAYYMLKKYKKAIHACQTALKIDKNIDFNPKYAPVYINMGNAFLGLKKYEKAENAYKKAIKIDPNDPTAYNNLGYVRNKLEKYKEAIGVLNKAIEIKPKFAHPYRYLGNAFSGLKEYKKAIDAYKKAIELSPGFTSAKTNLAEAYLITGHYDDAQVLTNDMLKEKDISTQHILVMRLVSICSMVFQGKQAETDDQLKDFIKYYNSIPKEYERGWEYNTIKTFITQYKKIPTAQKNLLLQLIDLLESTKKQGDKKLKELEIAMGEVFK